VRRDPQFEIIQYTKAASPAYNDPLAKTMVPEVNMIARGESARAVTTPTRKKGGQSTIAKGYAPL